MERSNRSNASSKPSKANNKSQSSRCSILNTLRQRADPQRAARSLELSSDCKPPKTLSGCFCLLPPATPGFTPSWRSLLVQFHPDSSTGYPPPSGLACRRSDRHFIVFLLSLPGLFEISLEATVKPSLLHPAHL